MYLYLLSVALFIQLLSLILITFHILITSNTPRTTKGTVLRRRLRWAAWRYSTGKEASLALPLLLITQHLYKRHFCRLLTWFVVFPEAFLAFAAQVSCAVQEAVDLMAVLADEYAALFFPVAPQMEHCFSVPSARSSSTRIPSAQALYFR